VLTRETQVAWNHLGGHVNPYNPALGPFLRQLGLSPDDPRALALLAQQVGQQAQMTAMLDVFVLIVWSFVLMLPLVLLLKHSHAPAPRPRGTAPTRT
jgi:DHA2 family multidrug resistance protein